MINFTKKYVNTVSLIISIIIFCFLNNNVLSFFQINYEKYFTSNKMQIPIEQIQNEITLNANNENKDNAKDDSKSNNVLNNTVQTKKSDVKETKTKKTAEWQIEIPTINLKATIAEGTTKQIMDDYVGHFEETSKDKGTIGLAAHNRGYKVNYFQDLKRLKEGDEIIYTYNGKKRKYEVKTHKIIKDTDWTFLENTEDNRITLITCVENEPEYRRCIQGIEIIE